MDRTLWKLGRIGERLWMSATLIAAHAASLENRGKGLAVVAEEARRAGELIEAIVEKAAFEGEAWDSAALIDLLHRLNLLAFNGAIEASRIHGFTGRQAAIYAEEIRALADASLRLFDEKRAAEGRQAAAPWAAHPSSAARGGEFLLMRTGSFYFAEPLANIQEVCVAYPGDNGKIRLRSLELPRIDLYGRLGEAPESRTHVIVTTPWAGQNSAYAVAADPVLIFYSPIGRPQEAPDRLPLAGYARECWENETGGPLLFLDWERLS